MVIFKPNTTGNNAATNSNPNEITSNIPTIVNNQIKNNDNNQNPYQKGVELIDSLLGNPTNNNTTKSLVPTVLTPTEASGLLQIRQILLSAHIQENHIPSEILASSKNQDPNNSDGMVTQYLVQEFGGVRPKVTFKQTARNVLNSLRFLNNAKKSMMLRQNTGGSTVDGNNNLLGDLPPEWNELSLTKQKYVYQMLKYGNLSKWEFDVKGMNVACGEKPLLFIGWAIFGAPHAQRAMARSLNLEEETYHDSSDDNNYNNNNDNKQNKGDKEDKVSLLCDFMTEFHINPSTLLNFLRAVESDYSPQNPYHNAIHAADVLQTTFSLLRMGGDRFTSSPLEMFAILTAAACHDMGHPGRNNSYQVNSKSDLAIIYNDSSVLENMHAARAFRLLSIAAENVMEMDMDILCRMQPTQKNAFRALFCRAILSTDMSLHFSQLANLKAKISKYGVEDTKWFCQTMDGRSVSMVLLFMLHAADVSNPTKPGPLFSEWCDRCLEELFAQGDDEKKRNLPISPMCDRENTNKCDSQIGFIKFIVRPAFVLLSDLIPNVVNEILPTLEKNLKYWENQKLREMGIKPVEEEEEVKEGEEKEVSTDGEMDMQKKQQQQQQKQQQNGGETKSGHKSKDEGKSSKQKMEMTDRDLAQAHDDINSKHSSKPPKEKKKSKEEIKALERKRSKDGTTTTTIGTTEKRRSKEAVLEKKRSKEYSTERRKSKDATIAASWTTPSSSSKPLERKRSKDGTSKISKSVTKGSRSKKEAIKSKEEVMEHIFNQHNRHESDGGSIHFS